MTKKSKDGLKGVMDCYLLTLLFTSFSALVYAGIISALAFCPDYSGLYAAATYSATSPIALFDQSSKRGAPIAYVDGARSGGVSQLHFHPSQPHILFAASRKNGYIQRWDLRNPTVPLDDGMFRGASKSGGTNQRMWFDIDLGGQWLASGNEVRHISISCGLYIYFLMLFCSQVGMISCFDVSNHNEPVPNADPILTFKAHDGEVHGELP